MLKALDALASLICACDIVVTVSNANAHLAGALGKETYLMFRPCAAGCGPGSAIATIVRAIRACS